MRKRDGVPAPPEPRERDLGPLPHQRPFRLSCRTQSSSPPQGEQCKVDRLLRPCSGNQTAMFLRLGGHRVPRAEEDYAVAQFRTDPELITTNSPARSSYC